MSESSEDGFATATEGDALRETALEPGVTQVRLPPTKNISSGWFGMC